MTDAVVDDIDALLDHLTANPEPGVERPREQLIWQFATQARACRIMGSELYAHLLSRAIEDLEDSGPCWRLASRHVAPGRGNAIALRLMAAVHRLVLTGRAPELERFYAATDGHDDPAEAWPVFHRVVEENEDELVDYVRLYCQTNESGRSASLALGYLEVARRTGLPLAIIEIGTAAGLNLRWDQFHYAGGGQSWGDPSSPVDLSGFWVDPLPVEGVDVTVVSRTGVDRAPIDPLTEEGRLALMSSVWGDQTAGLARLKGAIEIASRVPAEIHTADGVEWVEANLSPQPGAATVLVHSVVREYLDEDRSRRLDAAMEAAGAAATADSPVAWIQLEPISLTRRHGLSLNLWPGGAREELSTAKALGADVRRVDAGSSAQG